MEPNESNPLKPQPTGGLKLMTVFIAVLALHVLVIGGFTVWHLLYPANTDNDLALDKTHKAKIVSDSSMGDVTASDSTPADKTAATTPAATDNNTTDTTVSTDAATPASTAPAAPANTASTASDPTANSVITVPASPATPATPAMTEDASASAANSTVTAQIPSGPIHNGPVVNPPDNLAPPAETPATSTSVATDATTPATVSGTAYTVKRGDSLAKIAHRHHVAVAKLRSANGLASDALHIGQKLTIPGRTAKTTDASEALASGPATPVAPAATTPTYPVAQPVQESDSVTPTESSSLAGALPKHTHKTAAAGHHLYTVVRGDTLTKIAKRYHTTTTAIMAANSLTNAGRLSIGQKLHIPSHQSREAATAEEGSPQETAPHSTAKGQLANYTP